MRDFADSEKSDLWHDHCSYASASFVLAVLDLIFSRDHAYSRIKHATLDVDLPISGGVVVTMDTGKIVAVDCRDLVEASCRADQRMDPTCP